MSFLTIKQSGSGLYKEKGSKFLGYTFLVKDEQDVKTLVDGLRKEHPGACHVCYAFKLGPEGKIYRASDDGEPNNSAGQPILGQINAFGVTEILVAVVRYYGGTKLGVSGLIQAYRTAAKEALANSGTLEQEITTSYEVHCTYEQMPILLKEVKRRKLHLLRQVLDLRCDFVIEVVQASVSDWEDFMRENDFDFEKK